jgi:serine protease AprX
VPSWESPVRLPVPAALALALLAAPLAGTAAADEVRAVVLWDGPRPALPGVVDELPALSMAVVEVPAGELDDLAALDGVRGVAQDVPVELADDDEDDDGQVRGVPAAEGLGGGAGKKGAGAGVRIAVVDTGVSDTAALSRASGRLVDAHSSDGAAPPYVDGYGHGTHMATVAAGGKGVGVAPGATVLVVRVADAQGRTSLSQVLSGLDWVVANADRVDVANLSFAHTRPGSSYGRDPLVDAVRQVREAGVLPVVAAGNEPDRVGDPGFAPEALTVGAADLSGKPAVAPFSGSAVVAGVRKPDVVANGVRVLGALPEASVIARDNPGARDRGGLYRGSGTSQATAVASGVAALRLAERPASTPVELKAAVRGAAQDLRGDRDGAGLLRLAKGSGNKADAGESGFQAGPWQASSWAASSWAASSWAASSWAASSWAARW